jgi:hypothetical protein
MEHATKEADRLRSALLQTPVGDRFYQLLAAQQALAWMNDPETFKSPYDLVSGNPEGLEDCPSLSGPVSS